MSIDNIVEVEEIEFMKNLLSTMSSHQKVIDNCSQVYSDILLYKNSSYQVKYYFDTKKKEYIFKAYKTKIGFK